jgi:hypothetical protein
MRNRLSPEQVSQGQRHNRDDQHESRRHEFFSFGESNRKHHEQGQEKDVGQIARKPWRENAGQQGQDQQHRENSRHDEGHFAFTLKETDHPADKQEDDINPKNLCRKIVHVRQVALIRNDLQAQNLTRFAFGDDLKGTATDFAIGYETLGGDTGVHGDLEGLAAERALNGTRRFHVV